MVPLELSAPIYSNPHRLCCSRCWFIWSTWQSPRHVRCTDCISFPGRNWYRRRIPCWICRLLWSNWWTQGRDAKPLVHPVHQCHDRLGFRHWCLCPVSFGRHLHFRPPARCMENFLGIGCCPSLASSVSSNQAPGTWGIQEVQFSPSVNAEHPLMNVPERVWSMWRSHMAWSSNTTGGGY